MQYKCTKCQKYKDFGDFPPGSKTTGLASWCRECTRQRAINGLKSNRKYWIKHNPREETCFKKCIDCRSVKPSSYFGIRRNNSDGLNGRCKSCDSKHRKKYRKDKHRRNTLKYLNITESEFNDLWSEQKGICALCDVYLHTNSPRGCHIDHCHITGRIRGLLCGGCNTALGKLGDTKESIEKVLAYVS